MNPTFYCTSIHVNLCNLKSFKIKPISFETLASVSILMLQLLSRVVTPCTAVIGLHGVTVTDG